MTIGAAPKSWGDPCSWANPLKGPAVTGQHLRPLSAFVAVAIVGAVVFANALRAQDVVDAIRGGTSSIFAGTPLLHDPLYVVEDGERIQAAEVPEPEVDSSTGASSEPVVPGDGAASSADAATPVPTPAAGGASGTQSTGTSAQGGSGGQAAGGSQGAPKAPTPGKAQGQQGTAGQRRLRWSGWGSQRPGDERSRQRRRRQRDNGHGKGDDNGLHKAKGHDRAQRGGEDHDEGHDGGREHGKAHEKAGHASQAARGTLTRRGTATPRGTTSQTPGKRITRSRRATATADGGEARSALRSLGQLRLDGDGLRVRVGPERQLAGDLPGLPQVVGR